jgi:hypothetical protein
MTPRPAIIISSSILCFSLALVAAEDLTPSWTSPDLYFLHGNPSPGWPEVHPQARPGSYWWWPGSAVTHEDLTWNLETYHKAGWGNMGAIGIYGVQGEEENVIPLFTPKWFEMFNHAVTEARRLGMNIDLTPSGGWRLGGPHVTTEHSERTFTVKDGKIEIGVRNVRVKRTGPGGEGLCINPYSPAAVKFHFDWMADRFREGKGLSPRAFYYDSFENQGNWAPELPDRFQQWRGYDIHAHAAALGGSGDPEEVRRVLCDYRETLSDILLECVNHIARWGYERGSGLRMQAHGAPANLLDMYAAASIPETEVFGANKFDIPGFRRDPLSSLDQPHSELVHRFASSAAHVAGRDLVISESFTWLRNHFHTALSHIKPEADRLLLCGINGIYYHGTCYAPEKTEWPGWLFYASTQVNARNSIFRDIPALNAYLTRCQSVLQQGKPHNDILLYWPVYDLWMSGGKGEKRFSVHDSSWIEKHPCGEAGRWLMQHGHTFDFVSDAQLAGTRTERGLQSARITTTGGTAYRTVLVPAAKAMKVETIRKLIELANAGANIAIWKNLPETVPGWHNYTEREKELKSLLSDLQFVDGIATIGQGRILLGDDLADLMAKAKITREPMAEHGLKFIRRTLPGEVVYFIANQTANPVDAWIAITAPTKSAVLMDPMTGALGKAHTQIENAHTSIHLQLQPGESRILRALENEVSDAPPWPTFKPSGEPLALNGPWDIQFLEGGPTLPAPATVKTLASWTETADPEARGFAGTACYSTSFTIPTKATRWLLDLGDVRESARVRINGKPAGMVIAHPFRLDITDFLKDGENNIEIEVTNLSANRIRDLDQRKVGWKKFHEINFVDHNYKKFDASEWPIQPSGLLGPVTLQSMTRTIGTETKLK